MVFEKHNHFYHYGMPSPLVKYWLYAEYFGLFFVATAARSDASRRRSPRARKNSMRRAQPRGWPDPAGTCDARMRFLWKPERTTFLTVGAAS